MLDAPTRAIAYHTRGEHRVAALYQDEFTGEHGNYIDTYASAGYVGGLRLARSQTEMYAVGRYQLCRCNFRENLRLSLAVFAPTLVKYIADTSEVVVSVPAGTYSIFWLKIHDLLYPI